MKVTKQAALQDLLDSMFTTDTLRLFTRRLPGGIKLLSLLPGSTSPHSKIIFDLTDELERRGMIDGDFFAALVLEYPGRRSEIEIVAAAWDVGFLTAVTTTGQDSSPTIPTLSHGGSSSSSAHDDERHIPKVPRIITLSKLSYAEVVKARESVEALLAKEPWKTTAWGNCEGGIIDYLFEHRSDFDVGLVVVHPDFFDLTDTFLMGVVLGLFGSERTIIVSQLNAAGNRTTGVVFDKYVHHYPIDVAVARMRVLFRLMKFG